MRKILASVGLVILLSGCAHIAPKAIPPQYHAVKVKRPVAVAPAAPPVVVAPPVVIAPAPKTFKQRWLSKFFRDRAAK